MGLRSILRKDLAIDLGTANTLVYVAGEGIVLNEPTYVEMDQVGEAISLGQEAYERYGKTPPGHRVYRPLKDGVIEDFEAATALIKGFIKSARGKRGLFAPRVLIGVPSKMTQLEKRSILEAARLADIKSPYLMEETMAAAIGAGHDIFGDEPAMVVDVGGGTTEAAVIERGGFVHVDSVRVAGDEMDYAIRKFIKEELGLYIGQKSAERIKWMLGSARSDPIWDALSHKLSGKDIETRLPKTITITCDKVRQALKPILDEIAQFIHGFIMELAEGYRDRLAQKGLILTGGGALIKGFDAYLQETLGVRITMTDRPLLTVVEGVGLAIEEINRYRSVFLN